MTPWLALIIVMNLSQPIGVRVATKDMCQAILDTTRHDLGERVVSANCYLVEGGGK